MSSQASNAGGEEARVRRDLVKSGHVDIMISIRGNFFYTRAVPCELWFLNKAKPKEHHGKVLMIDARGSRPTSGLRWARIQNLGQPPQMMTARLCDEPFPWPRACRGLCGNWPMQESSAQCAVALPKPTRGKNWSLSFPKIPSGGGFACLGRIVAF